jgi:hypothetical protein
MRFNNNKLPLSLVLNELNVGSSVAADAAAWRIDQAKSLKGLMEEIIKEVELYNDLEVGWMSASKPTMENEKILLSYGRSKLLVGEDGDGLFVEVLKGQYPTWYDFLDSARGDQLSHIQNGITFREFPVRDHLHWTWTSPASPVL